jgi:type I restriction enzyme, S subunit
VAGEWQSGTLADVASAIQTGPFGSQLHAHDYRATGVPVVMPLNIEGSRIRTDDIAHVAQDDADRLSRHKLQLDDLVFSRRGDVDKCAIARAENVGWLCGTGCLLARIDRTKADPAFIAFQIGTEKTRSWLKANAVGLVMPNLNTGILGRLPLRLPPIREQQAIAATLSALHDKIELNRRMTETLDAMARTLFKSWLFKSWFVDFDPVRAATEGRATGLPSEIADRFPKAFDETGQPLGWHAGSLVDVAHLNPENWTRNTIPEVVRYVDLANTKWGTIEAVQDFPKLQAPSRAQRVLRSGDTIVGIVRPGNRSYAHIWRDGLTGSTGFAVLRPRAPEFAAVIYFAVTEHNNIETLASLADGAAYPAVRPEDVIDTPLVVASNHVFEAFETVVSPMLASMHAMASQSHTLADLRDTLLPKLISGEIRISDAEKRIVAA